MNRTLVEQIVDAVLYEGYILYPYRPSLKNRQRWTFGCLYPEVYCREQAGSEAASNQTECLVQGTLESTLDLSVRFLHLTARIVSEFSPPLRAWPQGSEPPFHAVETLRVGDQSFYSWQEAEERNVDLSGVTLAEILRRPRRIAFMFPGRRWLEPLHGPGGEIVGALMRQQHTVAGSVRVEASRVAEGLFKVTLRVANQTLLLTAGDTSRDSAMLQSLVSTHSILAVAQGQFVSLLDTPEQWREAAADCKNVGTWPVLVGAEGARDTMLSSPIILYDYPHVAPESPGNLFDGTEIDEILTLRILTLTDEEKRAAAELDERGRDLLARTETLAREQLYGLHGTMRPAHPVPEGVV
jgi:hydrogenase maturation protease